MHCPFCLAISDKKVLYSSEFSVAIRDAFPVTEKHILILPKRHVSNFFFLSFSEQVDALKLIQSVLSIQCISNDVNIGINIGKAAGQTIEHTHLHIIPRFPGDTKDPRGGIRKVISEKATYPYPAEATHAC